LEVAPEDEYRWIVYYLAGHEAHRRGIYYWCCQL
jgi:hypothetical protein